VKVHSLEEVRVASDLIPLFFSLIFCGQPLDLNLMVVELISVLLLSETTEFLSDGNRVFLHGSNNRVLVARETHEYCIEDSNKNVCLFRRGSVVKDEDIYFRGTKAQMLYDVRALHVTCMCISARRSGLKASLTYSTELLTSPTPTETSSSVH
jgi:hypothetical protein